MIEVVNLRTCNDWGKPGDVLIDRRTMWGNPFKLPQYSREASIQRYEVFFQQNLAQNIGMLKGVKRLGCWCKPLPCHGDVIKKYLEMVSDSG